VVAALSARIVLRAGIWREIGGRWLVGRESHLDLAAAGGQRRYEDEHGTVSGGHGARAAIVMPPRSFVKIRRCSSLAHRSVKRVAAAASSAVRKRTVQA
jgi:hypothetical protein